ncbi:hypothetical protein TBR22_A53040 [Luteitalea sp. TBR-22]|nr:hypothetical protein TBR22_A53040 [Luteitalea sp. TBR-22]
MTLVILVVAVAVASASTASAATRTAASCAMSDVQAAVNAAADGDEVRLPQGTCTWSGYVSTGVKRIALVGAGKAATVIVAASNGQAVFGIAADGASISAMTLDGGASIGVGSNRDWRIHDIRFRGNAAYTAVYVRGTNASMHPRGLIDHCEFLNGRVLVHGYAGVGPTDLRNTNHWSEPLALGSAEAVYVEANAFTFTVFYNAIDCEYSGRMVFRYNSVTDSYLESHSIQGHARACRKWEIYDNTLRQANTSVYRPMFLRGGTGVVFGNTFTGNFTAPAIHLDNVRTFTNVGGEVGQCSGASVWDGNAESNGYPCRDQIGRGRDAALWSAAPYPAQSLEPAYFWDNTINGAVLGVEVVNGSAVHIKSGRDYVANAGAKPGYVPYQYPHPLSTPAAPSNLRLIPGQ